MIEYIKRDVAVIGAGAAGLFAAKETMQGGCSTIVIDREIDRVYRRQRSASRKAGGCGICYFVRIRGQDARLFYEDSPDACRWFVETKNPIAGDMSF